MMGDSLSLLNLVLRYTVAYPLRFIDSLVSLNFTSLLGCASWHFSLHQSNLEPLLTLTIESHCHVGLQSWDLSNHLVAVSLEAATKNGARIRMSLNMVYYWWEKSLTVPWA